MTEHTPGPWRAIPWPSGDHAIVHGDPPGYLIAKVFDPDSGPDAVLLAAAPELLAQLCTDAERFRSFARYCREYAWPALAEEFDRFAAETEAVIAKANKGVIS